MNRISSLVLGLLLAASLCYGQSPTATPSQAAPASRAIAHGAFPVKVTKTLDSSKLKEGDTVELETSGSFKLADGTLVPKGSKLTGHVVSAKARSNGDGESQLNIAFDKVNVSNGTQLSIKGMVQAVFPPSDDPDPGVARAESTAAGGGIAGATVGITPNVKVGSNTETTSNSQPAVDPKSLGVQGFRDLSLDKGVLGSKGKQVKLGNGVRMIVHVDILG